VLRDDLRELLDHEPFEPFRVRLVNGDYHDIFYPQNVALLRFAVYLPQPDQNWVIFPINKIADIKSLIADYHAHAQP
jgi:hypothetical protein